MSGFVGFTTNGNLNNKSAIVRQMAERISHRGPDGQDFYVDDDIALGFRRLAIVDPQGGSQPILNEDGSLVLLCNGDIYNYRSIREELITKGHTFKTNIDSEVILHGYEEYGAGLLDILRGTYAFVIWDNGQKKLIGARDIFGIKPFYYYHNNGEFMFGSEIKAFLPHPGFKKELNIERLPDYLCFEYIPTRETMFKDVYNLQNGEYFEYQKGKMVTHKYYDVIDHIKADHSKTLAEWEDEITKEFTESVEMHKISDVEVGCFLSSGVDSSFVVKEFSKVTKDVKTFSVGYEEEKYSELPYAQEFSKRIGVENIANKVSADEFFAVGGKIQYLMDEPLPNPSEIPLYFLSQNAAKYVKIVLSGEGADELFGGYPIYLEAGHFSKYSRIPRVLRVLAANIMRKLPNIKGKRFIIRGAMQPYQRFMRANYVYKHSEINEYLKKPVKNYNPAVTSKPHFDKAAHLDEPTMLQYVDMQTWMLYDILQKADRMTMANSLELRAPFMDKKILELAFRLPTKYKIDRNIAKVALRGAAAKQIPERVANRKKLGFPVPLNDWLREDKYHNMVRQAFTGEIADMFFKREAILKLLDDHKKGCSNMKKIWSVYSFILWYEQFFILN